MMSNYTEGNWEVLINHDQIKVMGPDDWLIADVALRLTDDAGKSNAQLIATSPELLEAAENLMREDFYIKSQLDFSPDISLKVKKLKKAINKAKGADE